MQGPPESGRLKEYSVDDYRIDQGWNSYSAAEHDMWRRLVSRQDQVLPGRACAEYLAGIDCLGLRDAGIPDFGRLSDVLEARTGWRIVAVPGLIPDQAFFAHLAERRFPAGNFIRTPAQLEYLTEPDVFHDIYGHAPMLANRAYADFACAFGKLGLQAAASGGIANMCRLYWYSLEFGLVHTDAGLRAYGAGIVSSPAETVFALESPSPNRLGFDLERVMRTDYRIDDFQETYFAIDSLDALYGLLDVSWAPLLARLAGVEAIGRGARLAGDNVLSAGSGDYHRRPGDDDGLKIAV